MSVHIYIHIYVYVQRERETKGGGRKGRERGRGEKSINNRPVTHSLWDEGSERPQLNRTPYKHANDCPDLLVNLVNGL